MIKFNTDKKMAILENFYLTKQVFKLSIGDTITITLKNLEEDLKKRMQEYTGVIIAKNKSSINTSIIVRKDFYNIGVEKHFLLHSPKIESIKILKFAKVRRAKLYYLRTLKGKRSRLKQIFKKN
uniref:50S ribosomal protein L19, chloroplastic n=1 Tax=Nitzschia alba TaxID=2858 RepID=A0A5C0F3D8_NITAL|nr:50S ribosomal protein L19 [Nitzschia alba]QEI59583.1 50S ribosomal protein L19 [Nitzschia alba]